MVRSHLRIPLPARVSGQLTQLSVNTKQVKLYELYHLHSNTSGLSGRNRKGYGLLNKGKLRKILCSCHRLCYSLLSGLWVSHPA